MHLHKIRRLVATNEAEKTKKNYYFEKRNLKALNKIAY